MKKKLIIIGAVILVITILGVGISFCFKDTEKELYCETGELDGNNCRVITTEEPTYTCENMDELVGDKCRTVVFVIDAKKGEEEICKEGYSLYYMNGSNMCVSIDTYEKVEKKTCPEADEDEDIKETDGKCIKTTCSKRDGEGNCLESKKSEVDYDVTMVCPSGTRYIYEACRYYSYRQPKYSCTVGELDNGKCYVYDDVSANVSCGDGYEYDKESKVCTKEEFVLALER